MSHKPIKSWNISTRLQSKNKSWSVPSPSWFDNAGWKKATDYTTSVTTGFDNDIIALADSYKSSVDWDAGTGTYYELNYASGQPLSTLTVKTGAMFRDLGSQDYAEPDIGLGFYLVCEDGGRPVKVHEPWDVATVDASNAFSLAYWLDEWDYPLPRVEIADNMFNGTYMRRFRDSSAFRTSLTNLSSGSNMFNICQLDAESVRIIAEQIKDWSTLGGTHRLGLYIDSRYRDEVAPYIAAITAKGWTVSAAYTSAYFI